MKKNERSLVFNLCATGSCWNIREVEPSGEKLGHTGHVLSGDTEPQLLQPSLLLHSALSLRSELTTHSKATKPTNHEISERITQNEPFVSATCFSVKQALTIPETMEKAESFKLHRDFKPRFYTLSLSFIPS